MIPGAWVPDESARLALAALYLRRILPDVPVLWPPHGEGPIHA